jgi:hypothetical protein
MRTVLYSLAVFFGMVYLAKNVILPLTAGNWTFFGLVIFGMVIIETRIMMWLTDRDIL